MAVVKLHVAEAQPVQGLPGVVVAQQGGVALYIGVQSLALHKIGGDSFDFVGRTAVQSGLGDGAGDIWGDPADIGLVDVPKEIQV